MRYSAWMGISCRLPSLLGLCERYDAWLMLDDAHGFGVLGRSGAGIRGALQYQLAAHYLHGNAWQSSRCIWGFRCCPGRNHRNADSACARSYIYTTATPPLLSHALLKSLELIEAVHGDVKNWRNSIKLLKQECHPLRWKLLPSDTPIQPLVMGEMSRPCRSAKRCARKVFW